MRSARVLDATGRYRRSRRPARRPIPNPQSRIPNPESRIPSPCAQLQTSDGRADARNVARVALARRFADEALQVRQRVGRRAAVGQHHTEIEEQVEIAWHETLGAAPRVDGAFG